MSFYPPSSVRVYLNGYLALYYIHLHRAMILSEDGVVVGANWFLLNEYLPDRGPLNLSCMCET